MSEFTIEFYGYFENPGDRRHVDTGFELILECANESAARHFFDDDIDISLDKDKPGWALEEYFSEKHIVEGVIIAHESGGFTASKLVKALSALGANLVLTEVISETGSMRGMAYQNGKRSSAKKVREAMAQLSPTFGLKVAAGKRNAADMRTQIERGANVNGLVGNHPFVIVCADQGNLEGVRVLVENGADVNAKSRLVTNSKGVAMGAYGYADTALHVAAARGATKIVRLLLEHGANPNITNSNGWTPLHCATYCEFELEIIRALINAGADVSIADKHIGTPLFAVVEQVEIFLDYFGDGPKSARSVEKEIVTAVNLLVEAGSDVNYVSPDGVPLPAAARALPQVRDAIHAAGGRDVPVPAEVYQKVSSLGERLRMAVQYADEDAFRSTLIDAGESASDPRFLGSALHTAVRLNSLPFVKTLYETCAKTEIGSEVIAEARTVARKLGRSEIAEYLEMGSVS